MKFAALLTGAALAFANSVAADTEQFDMLTIHSTSKVHYNYIINANGQLYVEPYEQSKDLGPSVIKDDGKLKFGDKYVVLQDDGTFKLGTEDEATTSFGVQSGHVVLNCKNDFVADPVGDKYVLTNKGGKNAIGIALRATAFNGSAIPDFLVGKCSNATTTTLSSTQAPSYTPVSITL